MTSLLIADDHPLFRAALRLAASERLPGCVVREAADLPGALDALAAEPDTDLVLLDLHMPGSQGLSGLAALRGQHPSVAVLVVSAHDEPRIVRRVLDHGAAGFIPKSASPAEIGAANDRLTIAELGRIFALQGVECGLRLRLAPLRRNLHGILASRTCRRRRVAGGRNRCRPHRCRRRRWRRSVRAE